MGIRSLTLLTLLGLVSRYMMRLRRSPLYVEVTISMEVCRFSRWMAMKELQARAELKTRTIFFTILYYTFYARTACLRE